VMNEAAEGEQQLSLTVEMGVGVIPV
jgi:hypothetical protein